MPRRWPGLPPGIYFRLMLIGYFEGIDAERGIAWRADVTVIEEVVAEKGYHSRTTVHDLETLGIRCCISEPERGHENVLERLLVHASGFNLGLMMRTLFGIGTPRALQGRAAPIFVVLSTFWNLVSELFAPNPTQILSTRPLNYLTNG